jgi:hypothetical protein
MPNYKNGIIYKICCNNISITDCYVGSTCSFRARKCAHKSSCNNLTNKHYNFNVYTFIRANGGWENWNMVQVEAYEAKDTRDLGTRERFHMEQLNSTLNIRVPTRTVREYYEDNKEEIKINQKEYREEHKEEMKKYQKEYHEEHKEYQKDYYINHKEQRKIKGKEYREYNKLRNFILI